MANAEGTPASTSPDPQPLANATPAADGSPNVGDSPGPGVSPSDSPGVDKSVEVDTRVPTKSGDTTSSKTPQSDDYMANEVAPNDRMDDKSLPESEFYDKEIGENTENLSDMSEDEGPFGSHSRSSWSSSRFMSWFGHISPLLKNRKVRYLALVNLLLSAINTIILLVAVGLLLRYILLAVKRNELYYQHENPCIFDYGNWSGCSASCWDGGSVMPTMKRKVEIIIQARGAKFEECPANLINFTESAPCNFFRCVTKLSSFNFSEDCYYNNATLAQEGGCYRIRKVPIDKYSLIEIDANLTKPCRRCPDFIM